MAGEIRGQKCVAIAVECSAMEDEMAAPTLIDVLVQEEFRHAVSGTACRQGRRRPRNRSGGRSSHQ